MRKLFFFLFVLLLFVAKISAQCTGNCLNGYGTSVGANGDTYTGYFQNGKPDGKGICTWANGNRYTGRWSEGLAEGYGHITYSNGFSFRGMVDKNTPGAIGYYFNTDGSIDTTKGFGTYRTQGYVSGNCQDGFGTMVFDNGVYIGNFSNGARNGRGQYFWNTGDYYTGNWKDNLVDGSGSYVYADDRSCIGEFSKGNMTSGTNYNETGAVDVTASQNSNKVDTSNIDHHYKPIETDGTWKTILNYLLNDITNGLKAVLGDKQVGLLMDGYDTRLSLPGATSCEIQDNFFSNFRYESCTFYSGDDANAANSSYADLLSNIKGALPTGFTEETEPAEKNLVKGVLFKKQDADKFGYSVVDLHIYQFSTRYSVNVVVRHDDK